MQKQVPTIIRLRRNPNEMGAPILKTSSAGLNALEMISVKALVAYAAQNTGKSEEEIQQRLSARFVAANADQLPSRSYEDVIKFLVDLCDDDEERKKGIAP